MSVALSHAVPAIPVAALEAAVVVLPRPGAFGRLAGRCAPGWAFILPAIILAGTLGPITLPPVARALAVGVTLASPLVAFIAAVSAVRRWLLAGILLAVALPAATAQLVPGSQVALSVMTALACISVGVGLQRLIPRAWLLPAVVAMSVLDIALLASGIGDHQAVLLAAATKGVPGFRPTGVQLGSVYVGYPDLFLAALLGATLAGDNRQFWAGGLVFTLTFALETLLVPGETLPATLPLALTLVLISALPRAWSRARRLGRATAASRVRPRAGLPAPGAVTLGRS